MSRKTTEISNLRVWSRYVRDRAGNKCEFCGEKATGNYWDRLEAHHIFPQCQWPEISLDPNNGVALCRKCHSKFHIYLETDPGMREKIEWCGSVTRFINGQAIYARMNKEPD